MRTTVEILDALKRRLSITSDYALADSLGETRAAISRYRTRKGFLGNEAAFRAAELLEVSPAKIIAIAEAERAKTPEKKKKWEHLSRVAVVAFALITTPLATIPPYSAESMSRTLYIMSNRLYALWRRRFRVAFCTFGAVFGLTLSNAAFSDDSCQWRHCTFKEAMDLQWADSGVWSVQINGRSKHPDPGYNEHNVGLGLEFEQLRAGYVRKLTAGGFRNSVDDTSYYGGGVWQLRAGNAFRFDAGVFLGVMSYPSFRRGPIPVLLPALSIGTPAVGINVLYFPGYRNEVEPATFAQLRIRI